MDKFEYKVRADEIKELIREGEYAQAAEIADSIDWRRVKSVMMLCTVSDLYKINRRYEDAKSLLLLAYEKRPGGKTICYSLCELYIKTKDLVNAVKYCKEYAQVAPRDSGRYILQYKIYEAQDVSLEERIAVLEELKKRDYREKWAYELAYLYHRIGMAARCVEECDELILWFGEGKYVIKAMELKMLHQPLTEIQREKYEHRFDSPEGTGKTEPAAEAAAGEQNGWFAPPEALGDEPQGSSAAEAASGEAAGRQDEHPEEMDIQVKTMDVGKYNTINLQAELAAGLKEVLDEEKTQSDVITRSILAPLLDAETRRYEPLGTGKTDESQSAPGAEVMEESEVFFGETGEISGEAEERPASAAGDAEAWPRQEAASAEPSDAEEEVILREEEEPFEDSEGEEDDRAGENTAETVMRQLREESRYLGAEQVMTAQPPEMLARVLSQEPDGQLSLVVPEREPVVEKQITGQMNIGDVLNEWERVKRENEEKRREEVRQHVIEQTGDVFTKFEESVRDGLLEKLESGRTAGLQVEDNGETETPGEPEETGTGEQEIEIWELEEPDFRTEEGEPAYSGEEYAETDWEDREDYGEVEELEEIREDYGEVEELEEIREDYGEAEDPEEEPGEAQDEDRGADGWEAEDEDRGVDGWEAEDEDRGADGREAEDEDRGADGREAEDGDPGSGPGETEAGDQKPESLETEPGEAEFEERESDAREAEDEAVKPGAGEGKSEPGEPGPEDWEAEDWEAEDGEPEEEPGEAEFEERESDDREAEDEARKPGAGEGKSEPGEPEPEDWEPEDGDQGDNSPAERVREKPAGRQKRKSASEDSVERDKAKTRALTKEEKELYAPFIQSRAGREKLVKAIDNISMAAYTGNIIITGEEGMDKLALARNMIREVQMTDSNFSGKVARISGQGMNSRNVEELLEKLKSGALIIETASGMGAGTVAALHRGLQQERLGIIVILTDTMRAMANMLTAYPQLKEIFTARMDMEAMSNEALVTYGRQYAREMEYSIDELGVLALHTRIEEQQTIDHAVTAEEVRKIVDDAIRHANRKTPGHFFDILFAKRYDEEDMIILTEKDFA